MGEASQNRIAARGVEQHRVCPGSRNCDGRRHGVLEFRSMIRSAGTWVGAAVLALVCALLGAAAALGLARATGLLGGDTTKTVVVREPAPVANTPASVRTVAPAGSARFSPASSGRLWRTESRLSHRLSR